MHSKLIAGVIGAGMAVGACSGFLTGGELSNDPNRPTQATNAQLFVGVQAGTWALLVSDPARISGLFTQQLFGAIQQYNGIYRYDISEQTTNGFHQALYLGGGLVDIRKLEAQALASNDTLFVGIAQVMEALVMGTGADIFGDLAYTQALTGQPNPMLDPQLEVYDSVQTLLTRAIGNLAAHGPTNFGPGGADFSYGGDPLEWTKLAHTLKARFLIHTAKVRPGVFPEVLAEANQGLASSEDNLVAVFSGNTNEQNFWYQFDVVQRPGYIEPDPQFVAFLTARNDPRLGEYFNADQTNLADSLIDPAHTQQLVTVNETLLLAAEAASRTGDDATALAKLNAERALFGLPALSGLTGRPLLNEILLEAYTAYFQSIEAWNLYRRTCTPNLTPVIPGHIIPARLLYDAPERNTDSNIPPPSQQPPRNPVDPPSTTSDGTGARCLGQ